MFHAVPTAPRSTATLLAASSRHSATRFDARQASMIYYHCNAAAAAAPPGRPSTSPALEETRACLCVSCQGLLVVVAIGVVVVCEMRAILPQYKTHTSPRWVYTSRVCEYIMYLGLFLDSFVLYYWLSWDGGYIVRARGWNILCYRPPSYTVSVFDLHGLSRHLVCLLMGSTSTISVPRSQSWAVGGWKAIINFFLPPPFRSHHVLVIVRPQDSSFFLLLRKKKERI